MIVVTGSYGFIGKNLVKQLKDMGKEVIEVDIANRNYLFTYYYPDFKYDAIEHVYHLGAISSTTETNLELIYKNNIEYSIKLFEQCIKYKVPVSYASSASVYGNSTDYSINPLNYYALSKATVDMYVQDNINKFRNIRGYRFYNVYGEHEDHKGNQASPIYTFIKQAKETNIVKIFDNSGDGSRDFVNVSDVCSTMLTDTRVSGIYDVGTGSSYKFSELANCVAEHYNATVEVVKFPEHLKNKYQYNTIAKREHLILDSYINVLDYIKDSISLTQ